MQIIDTHTHLPGHTFGLSPVPISELRRDFESAGLTQAWLFTTDGFLRETARNNDVLAASVQGHCDFFIPFGTVNPHDGDAAALRELERMRRDLGMKGLKLHGWLQSFSMTHPAIERIMHRAGELGMPVIFHDGSPPYCSPLQIAAVAERVPGTTFILGHAGLDDLYQDAILACLRHPNIVLCCCAGSAGCIREIIRRCPVDRIIFGSDGGFVPGLIEYAIGKILAAGVSEAVLRRIFFENPRRLVPGD